MDRREGFLGIGGPLKVMTANYLATFPPSSQRVRFPFNPGLTASLANFHQTVSVIRALGSKTNEIIDRDDGAAISR